MIDRLFFAALTFCLLAGGTLAVGSALFEGGQPRQAAASVPVVHLPAVHVSGVRVVQVVRLPAVEIIGKRIAPATAVARTDSTEPGLRDVQ